MLLGQLFRTRAERTPPAARPSPVGSDRYRVEALETRLHLDAADFDPSFGTGGVAQLFINAGLIKTTAVTVDPRDGSSIVVGYTDVALLGDDPDFVVIRFLPNGQADPNFGFGFGFVVQDMLGGLPDFASSVAVQPDGKIVVAGFSTFLNPFGPSDQDIVLARFNPDGTLDASFGNQFPGIARVDLTQPFASQPAIDEARSVIIQDNGNIIVGGGTTAISEDVNRADVALVRFTPDGVEDESFGFDGLGFVVTELPNNEIFNALAVQADGRIVAVGTVGQFDDFGIPETTRVLITRYNLDGSVDETFNPDRPDFFGVFFFTFDEELVDGDYDDGYAVEIAPDGKILVGGVNGTRDDFGQLIANFGIARFDPDGRFDTSWGGASGGVVTDLGVLAGATDIAVQADGKVVVGGKIAASEGDVNAGNFGVAVVRYNDNGTEDATFGDDGRILLKTDFSVFDGPFANLPDPLGGPVGPLADGDDGLVEQFETFQSNTQGLIDVTPKGRILIVAFKDQTVRVAQVLGSGPPVANAALKGDRFTATPLPAIEFDVEYIDDVAVALATLGEGDLLIVGPGGVERLAQFVGSNGATGDGERLSGRYRFSPADGTVFKATDNGAYNILVLDNAVADAGGGFATRATVGSFELAIEGQVTPPPPTRVPGVAVASVGGKVPASVIGGDKKAKAALAVTLTNAAATDFAGPVTVTLFASTDGTVNPGAATQIAQVNANLKLKPAASKPVKVNALIPALATGNYTLVAMVAGAGTDNVEFLKGGPAVAVEQPVIRLTVPTAAPLPKPLTLGKTASVALPLRNGGNVMAKGTVAIELLASTDGTPGNATSLGVVNAKVGLKPNSAKPAKLKLTLPASLPMGPGTYTLLARLTAVGSLGAPNEGNGTIVGSIQVTFV
jgi:uncharacterized delta-60 repeat protein